MCTLSVSNVIYHKLSHGAAFYTLNGKNVNVMLDLVVFRFNFAYTIWPVRYPLDEWLPCSQSIPGHITLSNM